MEHVKSYTQEQVKQIVQNHAHVFRERNMYQAWEDYRKGTSLPSYQLITTYLTKQDIHSMVGRNPSFIKDKDTLRALAQQHANAFTTKEAWDQYAERHSLPKSYKYIYF
ncbi:hypothetical protein ACTWQB_16975, partial [Piscibacillus sp. B03]|uniref:hypothetical protein n=1 Tax=Piscibacillus sp. B03 TaxID=3457430 RepID=UPI003FCDC78C